MLRPQNARMIGHTQPGFSLVELMISITVGLVVLAGVTTMFAHNVKAGGETLKMARLHQELQATMSLMTRDLKRAGYWGNASSAIGSGTSNTNPFALDTTGNYSGEPANSCITFSYDMDGDGNLDVGSGLAPTGDPDERLGFRLRDGAVQTRQSSGGAACTAGGWEGITDTAATEITRLTFVRSSIPVVITVPVLPCDISTTSKIDVRTVTITLEGRLRKDTAVSRTLRDTVRVHNDLYQPKTSPCT